MAGFEIPEGWTAQAFRFALDPSPAQVSMLESHCGASRFAFNHGNHIKGEVARWWQANSKEAYNTGMDGLARALQN
jgi:putative transposase